MIVNVTYMNQKATALTDFNSIPVVPEYVEVENRKMLSRGCEHKVILVGSAQAGTVADTLRWSAFVFSVLQGLVDH